MGGSQNGVVTDPAVTSKSQETSTARSVAARFWGLGGPGRPGRPRRTARVPEPCGDPGSLLTHRTVWSPHRFGASEDPCPGRARQLLTAAGRSSSPCLGPQRRRPLPLRPLSGRKRGGGMAKGGSADQLHAAGLPRAWRRRERPRIEESCPAARPKPAARSRFRNPPFPPPPLSSDPISPGRAAV